MTEMDSIVDFLYQHMRAHLNDKELIKLIKTYRGHTPMYNHLNEIEKGLFVAMRDKKEVSEVWREAAKIALWVARIADLYEREVDRAPQTATPVVKADMPPMFP